MLYLPADAPQPGDKVTVGQLMGYLLAEGESVPVVELSGTAARISPRDVPPGPPLVAPTSIPESSTSGWGQHAHQSTSSARGD